MTKEELNALIFTVTQSVLSLIVVGGALFFIAQNLESAAALAFVGLAGSVLGFYFSQAINNNATNNALRISQTVTQNPSGDTFSSRAETGGKASK